MKEYWYFKYYIKNDLRIRFFYGTENRVNRRVKKYDSVSKELNKLADNHAEYLKRVKKVKFINL